MFESRISAWSASTSSVIHHLHFTAPVSAWPQSWAEGRFTSAHAFGVHCNIYTSASGPLGLPHEISASILALGEGLIKLVTLPQNTFEANLNYCECGWILIGLFL